MLRLTLLLSVSSMLVGCGHGFKVVGNINPEFYPHVYSFMKMAGITSIEVDMYFSEQTGNIIAVCKTNNLNKDKGVEVDPMWWRNASYLDQEEVIFHELAHCVLGQNHRDYRLSDGCPGSIMNKYHIGSYCYDKHYTHYMRELFREHNITME